MPSEDIEGDGGALPFVWVASEYTLHIFGLFDISASAQVAQH